MKKPKFSWNVFRWNVNRDELETYDVVPLLLSQYKSLKKDKRPKTKEEFSEFIRSEAMYFFWSKCECEVIIHGWPKFRNDEKVDIYDQLRLNWDAFIDGFWNSLPRMKESK